MSKKVPNMINYPNAKKGYNVVTKKHSAKQKMNTSNRGSSLEEDLNVTNDYYLVKGIANIHKKPTPIQIVKVDYPNRQAAKIVEAYFKTPSTTDYNGIYKGCYIDFEAKETKDTTKFVFKNIHQHQIDHLKSVIEHQGIAFFIIKFTTLQKTYLINAQIIIDMMRTQTKSISYDIIKETGFLIKEGYQPRLDYLKVVDQLICEESIKHGK